MKIAFHICTMVLVSIILNISIGMAEYVLIDRTEASINGTVILKSDLDKYTCYVSIKRGEPVTSLDSDKLLKELIDDSLIAAEASKTGLAELSPGIISKRAEEISAMLEKCGDGCEQLCNDETYPSERANIEVLVEEFIKKRIEVFVRVTEKDIVDSYSEEYGNDKSQYNDDVRDEIRENLKKKMVEREFSHFLQRVRGRSNIIIPGE